MVRDKAKALERLQRVLDGIPELEKRAQDEGAFKKWQRNARIAVESVFGEGSSQAEEFAKFHYREIFDGWVINDEIDPEPRPSNRRTFNEAQALLESMVNEIEEYWPDDDEPALTPPADTVGTPATNRTVFIAHGHDQGAKDDVARLVKQVGLEPVILSEQPSQGKTIIEKFEANSNVSYAIALLTADDVGGSRGINGPMRSRARQNVIFELGFFVGRLGRGQVCALTKGDPEIPSDYKGVVYIPMDEGDAWQALLRKELESAELDIDANKPH